MPENSLGPVAKDYLNEDVIWIEPSGLDLARLNAIGGVGNTDALAQFEKEQLAREIADIDAPRPYCGRRSPPFSPGSSRRRRRLPSHGRCGF